MSAPTLRERAAQMTHAAQEYTALGWPVFVLSPTKTPVALCDGCRNQHTRPEQMEACECLTCHGFYAATRDANRFAEMIRLQPRGLLAIRTGAASGMCVIDVDAQTGGIATMRQLMGGGLLPRTLAARTGNGGYHLVYAHPGVRILSGAGKGGPGVDIKADGGYVVAAPSVHPKTKRAYEWLSPPGAVPLAPLHGSLVERLRAPQPCPAVHPLTVPHSGSAYGHAAVKDELTAVLSAPEGTRNDTLHRAAFSLGQLCAGGCLDGPRVAELLAAAGERIGLASSEVRRTVASGLRAGMQNPRAEVRHV